MHQKLLYYEFSRIQSFAFQYFSMNAQPALTYKIYRKNQLKLNQALQTKGRTIYHQNLRKFNQTHLSIPV